MKSVDSSGIPVSVMYRLRTWRLTDTATVVSLVGDWLAGVRDVTINEMHRSLLELGLGKLNAAGGV